MELLCLAYDEPAMFRNGSVMTNKPQREWLETMGTVEFDASRQAYRFTLNDTGRKFLSEYWQRVIAPIEPVAEKPAPAAPARPRGRQIDVGD